MFPDFYVLGAAKSGTTSFHEWLAQHPDICMSNPKEPFFYEAEYDRGIDYYWDRYFGHYGGERIAGESRHRNLYFPYIAERINECTPEAKFIIVLRDPVRRAMSHWWHNYRRTKNVESDWYDVAFRKNINRVMEGKSISSKEEVSFYESHFDPNGIYTTYVDTGYYAEQIERYFDLFKREKFKIFLFEEVVKNPKRAIMQAFHFLGVDTSFTENVDLTARNRARLLRFGRKAITNFVRQPIGTSFVQRFKDMYQQPKSIDDETLDLLNNHFAPHNKKLERLLSIDLRAWG